MLARYRALAAKVDAFFDRVAARHGDEMQCAPGCDGCCRTRLTVTGIEATAITTWAAGLDAAHRAELAAAGRAARAALPDAPPRCAALDDDGRCRIYAARPLVCRSHGVPIRLRTRRGLPIVTACERNFQARPAEQADDDCILDQQLVSTTLGVLDRAAAGGAAITRHDLAAVLARLDGPAGERATP